MVEHKRGRWADLSRPHAAQRAPDASGEQRRWRLFGGGICVGQARYHLLWAFAPLNSLFPERIIQYHITTNTSSQKGSGTNANVFLTIFGKDGDTGRCQLKTSLTHKDKFESGQADEFIIEAANVGELTRLM